MPRLVMHGVKFALVIALALPVAFAVQLIAAQEGATPQNLAIEFSGVVDSVSPAQIIVNGRAVDVGGVELVVPLQPGMNVTVTALLAPDGRIVAQQIVIFAGGVHTPAPSADAPASTPDVQPGSTAVPVLCVRSQEYWRQNPDAWTVSGLALGAEVYTNDELMRLLTMPVRSDMSLILAHQLIAAKLAVASAGIDTAIAPPAILAGDTALRALPGRLPYNIAPSSPAAADLLSAASDLNTFNNQPISPDCLTPTAQAPASDSIPAPATTPEVGASNTVIEGVVDTINGSTMRVSGVTVRMNPAEPALSALRVGSVVRVEGIFGADNILDAMFVTVYGINAPATTPEVSSDSGGSGLQPPATTPEVSDSSGMGMGSDDDEAEDAQDEREDAEDEREDEREDAEDDREDDADDD